MATNTSDENFQCITENKQSNVEQIEPNVCESDPNIIYTENNIKTTVETGPLELPLDIDEHLELKPCFVELTRCDNIWKTFQLIRDLQDDVTSECSENNDNTEPDVEDEPTSSTNDSESYSSSTQANNTMAPYIKYQPVLNNGNSALNFQFSVKSTRILYQCHECGKQYSHRSTLREHSERIHHIILPIIRKKPETTNNDNKNPQSKSHNDFHEINKMKRDETSLSTEIDNNSTNYLHDDGALLDNLSDIHSSSTEIRINKNEIYTCHYCNRQYKDKYYFNSHLKNAHGTSVKGIRSYNKRSNDNSTDEQCSPKKARRVQQIEQSRNLNVHRCNTCGKHFYDKARLGDHRRKVHGIFANKNKHLNRINNRLQSNKSNKNPTKKNITHQSSSTAVSNVKIYSKFQHTRKLNPCLYCPKVYADRSSWKTHLKNVHDIKFAKFHKRPKEKEGTLICKECGKQYLSRRGLIEHSFTIHGQWIQHECETCGLCFPNTDTLIKHALDIHKIMMLQRIVGRTKYRQYKCQVCSTHFGLSKNLKWHLLEAHGIRNSNNSKVAESSRNVSIHHKSAVGKRPSTNKTMRKGLREKTRINYNEKNESNLIEQFLLSDTVRNKENFDESEKSEIGKVFICFLCHRRCIQIRRHIIEYHKIRHPDALIAQCKSASSNDEIDNKNMSHLTISKNTSDTTTNISDNENLIPVNNKFRSGPTINPNRLFMKVISPTGRKSYKCKICPNYVREMYELLRKHEKLHMRQDVPSPIDENESENIEQMYNNKKSKRTSIDNRHGQHQRLSDSFEHTRTTRATTKLKETRDFRCNVCDRSFRNAEILSSHKISCMSYHAENSSMNEASDTRGSSDRDSGIGISITIKKKNNSYEIVSREGNEDEKLSELNEKCDGELKEYISVSDNSSDTFAITANVENNQSEKSFPYSINHCVLKIQQVEDIDIDIDLDSMSDSPANVQCENNQELTSSVHDETSGISNSDEILQVHSHQLPSLTQLCKNVLEKTQENDKLSYKCRVCSKIWSSQASLNSHMKAHATLKALE